MLNWPALACLPAFSLPTETMLYAHCKLGLPDLASGLVVAKSGVACKADQISFANFSAKPT